MVNSAGPLGCERDDILAPHLCPALTAVAQPTREMGEAAIRLAMGGGTGAPATILLSTALHVRASTGPARKT